MIAYPDFFRTATEHAPYPFQESFASAEAIPHLLRAPTGAGKTATAILGWLWRRQVNPEKTPRRLVYCLPMRVLVEQSEREANGWIEKLRASGELSEGIKVHMLMGGAEKSEWFLHPEKPAILIGTQDMLLSRALNRGYAESRFHWPIDFGLLNNDCLWVFDEPQLMANGVATSAQLAGLRASLGVAGGCPSVWMSATLEPSWLDTIDFRGKFPAAPLELTADDYAAGLPLHKRMTASKTISKLGVAAKEPKQIAEKLLGKKDVEGIHQAGTQTLVVCNTVDRAKAVYEELLRLRKNKTVPELLLVHSRFRPAERMKLNEALQDKNPGDRILVATQVVEAGVDISSRTLVTELAPWSSIVQRIGRCNRTGDDGPGRVFYIDLDDKLGMPYEEKMLSFARQQLAKLEGEDVSPKALEDFKQREKFELPFEHKHVLRRRDLLDLFDTTPDLSGNDIDISRFVRSDDPDTDVQAFWREWPGDDPGDDQPAPNRMELCTISLAKENREFFKAAADKKLAFIWDHLDGEWVKLDAKQLRPGLVVMLAAEAGGYSELLGWDQGSGRVTPVPARGEPGEKTGGDPESMRPLPSALTIAEHTRNVCDMLEGLLKELDQPDRANDLRNACRWHDAGKAHPAFQDGMRKANPSLGTDKLWAKSGKNGKLKYGRKYFRHELASALAVLKQHPDWPPLVAYLIACHHGKVRLGIRSLPGEKPAPNGKMFALGIHDGDALPTVDLGGGETAGGLLDLSPMPLGGDGSWTAKALNLLAELGPFRLAYLEAIIRTADVRASRKEAGENE